MPDLKYEFEDLGSGRDDGFNESPSSNFLEDSRQSLAREALQNILDAKDETVQGPAIAKFELLKKRAQDIPNPDQLKSIFEACGDYYPQQNIRKFYGDAVSKIASNSNIKILKIGDYSTTGLSGVPSDENYRQSNFYCFARSEGSTNKGETSGGSWGLGKAAFYNLSGFKTIFYSSIFAGDEYVFGGLLDLSTHEYNNKKKQGGGSFGVENQEPVRDEAVIPDMFRRTEKKQGTDIYIVDFDDTGSWNRQMTIKILYNFWKAIEDGLLEVNIDNKIIDKNNLSTVLADTFDSTKPDTLRRPNPFPYYWAYKEQKETPFCEKMPVLGNLKMYYSFNNDYQNKIQFIRNNGMVIMPKKFDFPQRYAAVFVCESPEGNMMLRKMENPQHTDWKASFVKPGESEEVVKAAKAAEEEIHQFVKDFQNKIGETISVEETDIPEMEDILGIENPDEFAGFDNSMENSGLGDPIDEETAIKSAGEIKEIIRPEGRSSVTIPISTIGHKGSNGPLIDGHRGRRGHGGRGEEDPSGNEVVLKNADFRAFAIKTPGGEMKYFIKLNLKDNKKFDLTTGWCTENGVDYDSPVVSKAEDESGNTLPVEGNTIKNISPDEKGRVQLALFFQSNEKYAIGLKIKYENIK